MYSLFPDTRASLILRLREYTDRDAWNSFVEIYGPLLARFARNMGMQPADIDNLIQEVLLSVAKSIEGWENRTDRGRFRYWLVRVAHNRAIDLLSRRGSKSLANNVDPTETLARLQVVDWDRELDLAWQRELFHWAAKRVRESVADKTWQAFWLTCVDGLSAAEAAEKLKIPVGSIYFAKCRVMRRLRETVMEFEVQS